MDKYISDVDIDRFSRFLGIDKDVIVFESDIQSGQDIDAMFEGTNAYFCVLFKENPNPDDPVGHWTCLIKFNDTHYEYFDCLGNPVPENIIQAVIEVGGEELSCLTTNLMDLDGIICGKWVISRVLALPNTLEDYSSFFLNKTKGMRPDEVISLLFNLPIQE